MTQGRVAHVELLVRDTVRGRRAGDWSMNRERGRLARRPSREAAVQVVVSEAQRTEVTREIVVCQQQARTTVRLTEATMRRLIQVVPWRIEPDDGRMSALDHTDAMPSTGSPATSTMLVLGTANPRSNLAEGKTVFQQDLTEVSHERTDV